MLKWLGKFEFPGKVSSFLVKTLKIFSMAWILLQRQGEGSVIFLTWMVSPEKVRHGCVHQHPDCVLWNRVYALWLQSLQKNSLYPPDSPALRRLRPHLTSYASLRWERKVPGCSLPLLLLLIPS